ncbi:MAG: DUF58 domain-containing protein [Phycisphaerae bacterium]
MTTAQPTSPESPRARPVSALLDPRVLAGINRLELLATQVMDGFVQGLHRSAHVGFALDFAQHRQYVPGDDIKRIDWRVYAKADRFYIKQYEVTTNLRATIVLDTSASMGYQGAAAPASKLRYGQWLAAALGYMVLHQQDTAGLVTFDSEIREWIGARSAPSHLMNIIKALDKARAANVSAIAPVLHQVADRVGTRGMVIIISDFFCPLPELSDALHHLKHRRQETLLLQVLDPDERTFPFRNMGAFENVEDPADRLKLDPALVRAAYLDALGEHLHAMEHLAGKLNFSYAVFDTLTPLDQALLHYLARRLGSR